MGVVAEIHLSSELYGFSLREQHDVAVQFILRLSDIVAWK